MGEGPGDGSAQRLLVTAAFAGRNVKDLESSENVDYTLQQKLCMSFCASQ